MSSPNGKDNIGAKGTSHNGREGVQGLKLLYTVGFIANYRCTGDIFQEITIFRLRDMSEIGILS